MRTATALLAAAFLAAPAWAQLGRKARSVDLNQAESLLEDARLQALYDQFLASWAPVDPEAASALGLHAYDDRLTSRDEATARAQRGVVDRILRRLLDETDETRLDPLGELRYKTLLAQLRRAQQALARDERRRNPLLYLRTRSILDPLTGDYGPVLSRVNAALSRLEAWPGILAQARANLAHPPRLWTEAAIRECDAAAAALQAVPGLVEPTLDVNPENASRAQAAVAAARSALQEYKVFLSSSVLPTADGKPALGEEAFDRLLAEGHALKISNYKLLRLGEKGMKAAAKALQRAARDIDRRRSWQDLLALAVSSEVPAAADLKALYRRELESARLHFERQGILALPAETVRLEETPSDLRAQYPLVAYRAPAPLDLSRQGVFSVAPPDPGLPEAERARLLAWGHGPLALRAAVVREAWPGRHVMASRTRHAAVPLQRAADSPLFAEGWALYADRLARESGYYASAPARLLSLRAELLAAARAVLDVRLHCGDWSAEQARSFLEKEALLSPAESSAEVLRATLKPTEAMSGFVGAAALVRLRERMESRLGDQFTLREFHERLFAYGQVPTPLIEKHMPKDWVRR